MKKQTNNLFSALQTEPPLFSVSEYQAYVNEVVSFAPVLVQGEVSNYRPIPGRKFCYFDIKDEKSVAKCFQGFWSCPSVELKNGQKVQVLGYPNMQKNGSFVIDARKILLSGKGALMEAYLKLKEKLEKEGLFDQQHKKTLPKFPKTIGLIAGKNSSAYHDVTVELQERWQGLKIYFCPSKVQGIYASKEVVRAIKHFNQHQAVDVLIIARGGGSMEDLQAFDSEEVVREIFASRIPVISAIGHEDHWTLSDFVSDMRAKTPTKAAQIAVPSQQEVQERLQYFSDRMNSLLAHRISTVSSNLENLWEHLNRAMLSGVAKHNEKLKQLQRTLHSSLVQYLRLKKEKVASFESQLRLLDPQSILKRGYAIIEKNGRRVEKIDQVAVGDLIKLTLQDGQIDSKIEGVGKKI